jgi:hypothetical protein
MPDDVVYDIETFPNIFSAVFANIRTKDVWVFEISDRRNDEKALRNFMRDEFRAKNRHVGFNNVNFDYSVLHFILFNKGCGYKAIYDKAMSLIDAQDEDKFAGQVKAKDIVIPQVDLYKIHHFDNKARATSLKMLEFNMKMDNVSDLPFPVGTELSDEQKDILLEYNVHDVMATVEFYNHSKDAISFREKLSKKYGRNFMNHNDTKIGKEYFTMKLEEENPGCCYRKLPNGGRKINQTKRDSIDLSECIFDYVKFERPEFNAIKDWFEQQVITETKGVFTEIPEHRLGEVAKYAEMITKQKKIKGEDDPQIKKLKQDNPCGWVENRQLKSGKTSTYFCHRIAECLNVVIDGFRYDFGTGGIHGSVESSIIESDEDCIIEDWDYASYYPNLCISNRIYPEHLSEVFCDIYKDVYEERKTHPKGSPENAVMKLALNGVYGASNDQYSPLYDPKFTMGITINGQLTLCLLVEKLMKVDGLSLIQLNTDGITVKYPRECKDVVAQIVKGMDTLTGLVMENVEYKRMFIRDVNNYISESVDGKVKYKGAYVYDGLGWHQNQSSIVIQKAASYALLQGGDIEHFIVNHKDKYDFMLRTKVPRSSRLVTVDDEGNDTPEQNICRYYIANDGRYLTKIMPALDKDVYGTGLKNPETGEEIICKNKTEENRAKKQGFTESIGDVLLPKEERRIGINTGWKVKTCNDIKSFDWDIDYSFYIQEAEKLVKPLLEG